MQLTVGDVIRWNNFPYPKNGPIKPRWFVYLGRTSIVSTPVFIYLCTTTTQKQHFLPGGSRSQHARRNLDKRQFPFFEDDCILDFDEDLHHVTQDQIEKCIHDIEIRGRLEQDTMRNIYKQFSRPGVVSRMIMLDIHTSFNNDGITNLKKP